MEDQLKTYILDQLHAGKDVGTILAELKSTGHSDESINSAFKAATAPISSDSKVAPPTMQSPKGVFNFHSFDLTKVFSLIGAVLIISALAIVVGSEWTNVGPWARLAFLLVPTIILFSLAASLRGEKKYEVLYWACLVTGEIMFPFTLATFLYQFRFFSEISTPLIIVTALFSYVVYTIIDVSTRNARLSIFSLVALYLFASELISQLNVPSTFQPWILLLLSILVGWLGYTLMQNKISNGETYAEVGIIAASFLLPAAILTTLNQGARIPSEVNAIIFSLFGLVFLAEAIVLNHTYQLKGNKAYIETKRLLEELAPLIVILPYITVGYSNIGFMVIGIILSFLAIVVSQRIRIRTLLPIGVIGVVIETLSISGKYLVNSLGWPVVVFLVGFAMLGLAYLVRNVRHSSVTQTSENEYLGLGELPATKGGSQSGLSCYGCLTLLVAVWLIGVAYSLLSSYINLGH